MKEDRELKRNDRWRIMSAYLMGLLTSTTRSKERSLRYNKDSKGWPTMTMHDLTHGHSSHAYVQSSLIAALMEDSNPHTSRSSLRSSSSRSGNTTKSKYKPGGISAHRLARQVIGPAYAFPRSVTPSIGRKINALDTSSSSPLKSCKPSKMPSEDSKSPTMNCFPPNSVPLWSMGPPILSNEIPTKVPSPGEAPSTPANRSPDTCAPSTGGSTSISNVTTSDSSDLFVDDCSTSFLLEID